MKTCEKCGGTGVKLVPNGEDDVDQEYCDCPAGEVRKDVDKLEDVELDTL